VIRTVVYADNRAATSPALFNRCVIDWFGEWSSSALYQVGHEFTRGLDLGGVEDKNQMIAAADGKQDVKGMAAKKPGAESKLSPQRDAVVSTLVYVHESVREAMQQYAKAHGGRATHVTPRHYLDFIKHYSTLYGDKRFQLEEQQRHLNTGLKKLRDTQEQVMTLREGLQKRDTELKEKERVANEKLEQMMKDKAKAEEEREKAIALQKDIDAKSEDIAKRKVVVESKFCSFV
jgi:dynein heavy chain 1